MGENSCKQCDWQRVNIHSTQTAHIIQYKKNFTQSKKMGKRSKYASIQEDIQMANRHMKRFSTLLLEKCRWKSPFSFFLNVRYCLTHDRTATIKKPINNKCWRGCRERGTLLLCWWVCKLVLPLRKTVTVP